jgi:hypothetical protein
VDENELTRLRLGSIMLGMNQKADPQHFQTERAAGRIIHGLLSFKPKSGSSVMLLRVPCESRGQGLGF